ncbi:ATP-dependent DNA helicase UvrD2 [Millisia brevis]|uniref:ATP-dependent DNA helicase UvrD2 n=1 Tax=Millisia brevis TaxID=264148 RepID=UPI000A008F4E
MVDVTVQTGDSVPSVRTTSRRSGDSGRGLPLDPEQQLAVHAPRGPVCVLAGAGTGKTRTITHRIAHLVAAGHVAPGQVLAVTFTTRAAGELRTRLRALVGPDSGGAAVQASTFHAAALRQLRYFWPRVIGDTSWTLLDSKFALVGRSATRLGLDANTDLVRDLAGEIEWAKACLIGPEDYPAEAARRRRRVPVEVTTIARVYRSYEAAKIEAAADSGAMLLDFDDLLLHTAAALEDNAAVAAEFRDRYRCFVVDEYQDVTPLQQRLLDAWLGDRDDLTVVGDANQTIYSFTGAGPRYLLDFGRRFPDATVVRLERDYRSTPQVVSLANRVIAMARGREAGMRLELVASTPDGPEPTFTEYPDEAAEATGVVARIRRLVDEGIEPGSIAVLYRINAQSELYEEALSAAGIAFRVRGDEGFFDRPEIRRGIATLQRVAESQQIHGPGEATVPALVRAALAEVGLTPHEPSGRAEQQRWVSLDALLRLTNDLVDAGQVTDLPGLLREFAERARGRHAPDSRGVTLASLHAAKGLEWDAVFLVGLIDGTLPISYALGDAATGEDQAGIEEERRLFYVGITRARSRLHLSWALTRAGGGRTRRRSRFLAAIAPERPPVAVDDRRTPRRGDPARSRCRICASPLVGTEAVLLGRCTKCPADVDADLLEQLREWRTTTAAGMGVPTFVVLGDATLRAIAEQRPTDVRALVAIAGIGAKKLDRFGEDLLALVRRRG